MSWSLVIHHLDVGQGDATLIVATKTGQDAQLRSCLIDGGLLTQANTVHNYISGIAGLDKLDVMVATHYDADHFNGLTGLLKMQVNHYDRVRIFDQGIPGTITTTYNNRNGQYTIKQTGQEDGYNSYKNAIAGGLQRVRVTGRVCSNGASKNDINAGLLHPNALIGTDILWDGVVTGKPAGAPSITCIAANQYIATADGSSVRQPASSGAGVDPRNDKSLAFIVQFNDFKYYIGGDLTTAQEDGKTFGAVHAMKCSHHGSQHSSAKNFIKQLKPRVAFISNGIGNDYGGNHYTFAKKAKLDAIGQFHCYGLNVRLKNNNSLLLTLVDSPRIYGNNSGLGLLADDKYVGGVSNCDGTTVEVNGGDRVMFGFPQGGQMRFNYDCLSGLATVKAGTVFDVAAGAEMAYHSNNVIEFVKPNGSTCGGQKLGKNKPVTLLNGPGIGAVDIAFAQQFGCFVVVDEEEQPSNAKVTLTNGGTGLLNDGFPNQRVIEDLEANKDVSRYFMTNDREMALRTQRLTNGVGPDYVTQAYTAKAVVAGSGMAGGTAGHITLSVNEDQSKAVQFTVSYNEVDTHGNVTPRNINYPVQVL